MVSTFLLLFFFSSLFGFSAHYTPMLIFIRKRMKSNGFIFRFEDQSDWQMSGRKCCSCRRRTDTPVKSRNSNSVESNDTSFSQARHQVTGRSILTKISPKIRRLTIDIMIFEIKADRLAYSVQRNFRNTSREKPLETPSPSFDVKNLAHRSRWRTTGRNQQSNNEKTAPVRLFGEIMYFITSLALKGSCFRSESSR